MTLLKPFRLASYRRGGCERLPFPACAGMRVAQLSSEPYFQDVVAFPEERWDELPPFGPNILVSLAFELRRWMGGLKRTGAKWRCLDTAIFLVTMQGVSPVDEATRSMVWDRFGLPLYELYLGPMGRLLASECEAHDGWHLQPGISAEFVDGQLMFQSKGNPLSTGLSGALAPEMCECGSALPLVRGVTTQQRRRLRVKAVPQNRFAATA